MKAAQYGNTCKNSEARSMQALQKALLPRRASQAQADKAKVKNATGSGAENYAPLGIFSPSLARSPFGLHNNITSGTDPNSIFSPTAGVPRTPLNGVILRNGDDSAETPSPARPLEQQEPVAGNGYSSVPMGSPGMEMGNLTPNTRTALRC